VPLRTDQNTLEFRALPTGRDVHIEIKPAPSPDTRLPVPSNIGATFRKPRKNLVLCFDGTGEAQNVEGATGD